MEMSNPTAIFTRFHSSERGNGDDGLFWDPDDPTFFQLSLLPRGEPGGVHWRRGNPEPRGAITSFETGSALSRLRPAFTVSASARLIIHGTLEEEEDSEQATLLVYDFTFRSHNSVPIREARIRLGFEAPKGRKNGPLVETIAPVGSHEILGMSKAEVQAPGQGGLVVAHARVVGKRRENEWGHYLGMEWVMMEGSSTPPDEATGGIPMTFRGFVLLRRESTDGFCLRPTVQVVPVGVQGFLSTENISQPALFDLREECGEELFEELKMNRQNLAGLDLNQVWAWDHAKPSKEPSLP